MKRYLSLLLLPLLFGGCTLTLEEMPDPEPGTGPGYDEVTTDQTEFGSMEYQFRDSVLHVTQAIFDQYLVKVETDSLLSYDKVVLYFNEALPLVPPVDGKLAAGALIDIDTEKEGADMFSTSRALPYGLNHRVTEVQKINGMYRIEAKRVDTKEVYKHLKYCVDADIAAPDLSSIPEEELPDYGYQMVVDPASGDTIIQDWNEVEVAKGIRPRGAKRKSLKRYLARTRGDDKDKKDKVIDDDIPEENPDDEKIKSATFLDFMIDTRNVENAVDGAKGMSLFKKKLWDELKNHMSAVANKNAGKRVSADPYAAIGLRVVHYTRAHAEEDEDRGYELKYTDTWTDFIIKAELGFDAKNNTGYGGKDISNAKIPNEAQFSNMLKAFKEGGMAGAKSMASKVGDKWDNLKIRVILTTSPVPIAFIASATVTPVVEINGCISASLTCTTEKRRSGRKIEKNNKGKEIETKIDQHLEDGKVTPEVSINGSIKVGAQFRAAAGIEIAGTVSLTVGANIDTFLEAEASFNVGDVIQNSGDEGYSALSAVSGSVKFSSYFYFDLVAAVAPLGIVELWSKQLWKSSPNFLVFFSTKYDPTLLFNRGTPYFGQELKDWLGKHSQVEVEDASGMILATYEVFKLNGLDAWIRMRSYYPAMKLYFGPIKDNKWVWMARQNDGEGSLELTTNKWKPVEEEEVYKFWWMGNTEEYADEDGEIREAHIVPVLVSVNKINLGYAGALTIDKVKEYFGDMIALDKSETLIEVGKPSITSEGSGQIWGNTYEDTKSNPHYSEGYVSQTYGDVGGICSESALPQMRMYQFYHTVNVISGSRMSNWGLKVYVFDTNGKTRLYRRKIPIDNLRSGKYTFIFSFMTDWKQKSSDEQLYYRVQPYWGDPQLASGDEAFEAQDTKSLKKWPLKYEYADFDTEDAIRSGKNSSWGTLKDVNLNNNK